MASKLVVSILENHDLPQAADPIGGVMDTEPVKEDDKDRDEDWRDGAVGNSTSGGCQTRLQFGPAPAEAGRVRLGRFGVSN